MNSTTLCTQPATPSTATNLAALARQTAREILAWASGLAVLSLILRLALAGG